MSPIGSDKKIGVFIVDDSAVVRMVAMQVLGRDPSIEVLGVAPDPIFALEKMSRDWPDVIVLDIEMPRMDGITFLRKIMAERPTPVVICSSLTARGTETSMDALAAGAIGIVAKPDIGVRRYLMEDAASELVHAVKAAAGARLGRAIATGASATVGFDADAPMVKPAPAPRRATDRIVAIGTSTGGTQALEAVLTSLPPTAPGMVIVQHMPEKFTASFAARLSSLSPMEVREARDGDRVVPGCALIAPGGRHMLLRRNGARYSVEVMDGPLVNRHRPSVDVLFRSVARCAGRNAMGVIMTGMGDDGARGLKEMHEAGAYTVAQDEASSVVYGMPKEAVRLGAARCSLALHRIAGEINRFASFPA